MNDEKIIQELSRVLGGLPVETVMPVLIVASARALVTEAQGDAAKLHQDTAKFIDLMTDEIRDMWAKQ